MRMDTDDNNENQGEEENQPNASSLVEKIQQLGQANVPQAPGFKYPCFIHYRTGRGASSAASAK